MGVAKSTVQSRIWCGKLDAVRYPGDGEGAGMVPLDQVMALIESGFRDNPVSDDRSDLQSGPLVRNLLGDDG